MTVTFPAILSYGGLAVSVIVGLTDFGFLLWDAWLLFSDRPTISGQVWSRPALAVGVLGWQFIGVIGLAVHLAIDPHGVMP